MANPVRSIRIGTLVNVLEKRDPAEMIRALSGYGFESFQLTFSRSLVGHDLSHLADSVQAAIEGTDALISAIGIYGNPLEDGEVDRETRAAWEALIDIAPRFGCSLVTGFTGRLRGRPLRDSLPRFQEVFGALADRAASRGVRLAFENCAMDGNWASGDWNIAIDPDAWALMFDALPAAHLGLEWEPCHQMLALIDPLPQIEAWAPRLFHIHGKDASMRPDRIRRHGILGAAPVGYHRTPGFGDSNWTAIISELRRVGFEGSIDIEGWHDPVYRDGLEMTGQVAALTYLKTCRGGEFVPNPEGI